MSVQVFLNLLNKFRKKILCEAMQSILSFFSNRFNKFHIRAECKILFMI